MIVLFKCNFSYGSVASYFRFRFRHVYVEVGGRVGTKQVELKQ